MSEDLSNNLSENNNDKLHNVTSLNGLYENWFLDYASYVILDRAVPHINDGLKPVQRRILHSLKEMDDGRFNKAANVIGNTMKYHPHGDASIGDAMVQIGQKNLLIDCQGNWGDPVTGDWQQHRVISRHVYPSLPMRWFSILILPNGRPVMMDEIKNLLHYLLNSPFCWLKAQKVLP